MNTEALLNIIDQSSFLANKKAIPLMQEDLKKHDINENTLFFKLYSSYAALGVGNGPELFTLEQIDEYNHFSTDYLYFASDDGGTFVYFKSTDTVHEYTGILSGDTGSPEDLGTLDRTWESFKEFLEDYYSC